MIDGNKTHPMVSYFLEFHQIRRQKIIMRTVKTMSTALKRQEWESVLIDRLSMKGSACVYLKSEWGVPKLHH